MEALNIALFIAGSLIFVSVLAGLYSARAGLSFLLVFLVAGMLAGEDGPGGIEFDDFRLSMWIGSAALAVILLDGGLRTQLSTFRTGLKPAVLLATVGVGITALLTGAAAVLLAGMDPWTGLLVGAIVGSTDAAAVFALMKSSGLRLTERLAATLEIESGLNDPMAIFLVLAVTSVLMAPGDANPADLLALFGEQLVLGGLGGVAAGFAIAALLNRMPLAGEAGGLAALLLLSSGVAVFAGIGWAGGSGFLAVYLFGLVVAHRAGPAVEQSLSAMDGFAWLAQAGVFLLLGLLVTPSLLLDGLWVSLGVAAALMFVARPVAVALCLTPLRFTRSEIAFVSWVGLRGAVPVVLAVFPLMAGVPQARELFDIAFVVVLASLLLQGATLSRAAHWSGVNLPDEHDELAHRQVFGDFVVDPTAAAGDLFGFYGLPQPDEAHLPLADWIERRLRRPPVVGDVVEWDRARLAVRAMDGPHIVRVGLILHE